MPNGIARAAHIAAFALVALIGAAHAQSAADTTAKDDFQHFSAIPVLGYSEETELQYGAMTLFFFRPSTPGGKVPEIDITAYGSTRKQFQLFFIPYFYLYHDKISGDLDFRYQNWVGNYFGMGNDPDFDDYVGFDRERFQVELELYSSVGLPKEFNYGVKLHAEHSDISFSKCTEGGCDMELPDTHSGWRNGAGYILNYDTRNNTNWSTSGYLVEWQQMFYDNHLGDYTFDTESLDIRGYTPLFWDISMAVAALWTRANGDVPFDMLAGPDGTKRFRGVESLYFRDNQVLTLQAELRKKLFWRLAGDIFYEGSKVGDHFSELMRNKWHRAIGFGGMFALNMQEHLYARGEFSLIDGEKLGITVYIRSAF